MIVTLWSGPFDGETADVPTVPGKRYELGREHVHDGERVGFALYETYGDGVAYFRGYYPQALVRMAKR